MEISELLLAKTTKDRVLVTDLKKLENAVSYIIGLTAPYENKILKSVYNYLKNSMAYADAQTIGDHFGFRMSKKSRWLKFDFNKDYNLLAFRHAPLIILEERIMFEQLLSWYLGAVLYADDDNSFNKIEKIFLPLQTFKQQEFSSIKIDDCCLFKNSFKSCLFHGVRFFDCYMEKSKIKQCDIENSRFSNCNLDHTDFSKCSFYDVEISSCDLTSTIFRHSHLKEVDFSCSTFGANNLSSSTFVRCCFSFCDLSKVKGITQDTLEQCFGAKSSTTLPKGLKYPDFWPNKGDMFNYQTWLDDDEIIESESSLTYE